MSRCDRCGEWVDPTFQRVFSAVHGCPECRTWRAIYGNDVDRETPERYPQITLDTEPVLRWRLSEEPPTIRFPRPDPDPPDPPMAVRRANAERAFLAAVGCDP